MSGFTFLTEDQVFGKNRLKIFEEYGTKCTMTDFSKLLDYFRATYMSASNQEILKRQLKDKVGDWWTKSLYGNRNVVVVCTDGNKTWDFSDGRHAAARPAITYSEISSMCSEPVRRENGVLEVEYGEYPQMVVDENYSGELEEEFNNGNLKVTGKSYTTDSPCCFNAEFSPRKHIEYEYKGKKYIRFCKGLNHDGKNLHNLTKISEDIPFWVSVEPITWLVDEKADIALSEKIIFAGVQYKFSKFGMDDYDGDFDKTDIKQFMDTYFSKEIVCDRAYSQPTLEEQTKTIEKKETKKQNPYDFSFERVTEEDIIRGAIESGVAVFLHGASSEGKSSRIKQIDPDCVILYLRNATPESLNGKSVYNSETGEMIDIKPTWLKKLEERCEKEADKLHILFLDEITNALPSIQGMAFNIVLDREVNGMWELPKNARIVAAGNDMKDSLAANQLAEPLFNRFVHVYIKTTVDSWLKWASENKIHPSIYAYIAYKGSKSLRTPYNGEKPNADPRKWEMASKMLYATGKPEMLRGVIGKELTTEFCQFCKQKVITIKDVIEGNYTERDLEMDTGEKYATIVGLSGAKEEEYEQVREFVKKLGPEFCAIYDTMWSRGEETRMEMVAEVRTINSKGCI